MKQRFRRLARRHVDAQRVVSPGFAEAGHAVQKEREEVRLGAHIELAVDALAVPAHRFYRDIEALGGDVGTVAAQHQLDQLEPKEESK